MAVGSNALKELRHHLKTNFRVRHFAATKPQSHLDLHVLAKEVYCASHFERQVMRINAGAQLDFLEEIGVLVLAGFLFLLRLLVAELAVVNEPADGRGRIRCHLDQIHPATAGQRKRLADLQDTQLGAFRINNTHFPGADFTVNPDEGRRRLT